MQKLENVLIASIINHHGRRYIYMSHPVNTEILESLFDEQIDAVQKRFPSLSNREVEIIAARRAKRLFWEMAQ